MPDATTWVPTSADIAAVITSRTYTDADDALVGGKLTGVFSNDTRPTSTQVEKAIANAVADVEGVFASGVVPDACHDQARRVAELRAALAIEIAFFGNFTDPAVSPYLQLRIDADEALRRLVRKARVLDMFGECPTVDPVAPEPGSGSGSGLGSGSGSGGD